MLKKALRNIQNLFSIPYSDMKMHLSKNKGRSVLSVDPFTFRFRIWLKRRFHLHPTKKIGSFPLGEVWMDFEKDGKKLSLHYDEPWGWNLFSENAESDQFIQEIHDRLKTEAKI